MNVQIQSYTFAKLSVGNEIRAVLVQPINSKTRQLETILQRERKCHKVMQTNPL